MRGYHVVVQCLKSLQSFSGKDFCVSRIEAQIRIKYGG